MEDGDGGPATSPPSTETGIEDGEEVVRCTNSNCRKNIDENMIECKMCNKYTHFSCTRLPASHLQRFMTKGYSRYVCENCYRKDHKVHEDYTKNCYDLEWAARESELLKEIEKLKCSTEKSNEENSVTDREMELMAEIQELKRSADQANEAKATIQEELEAVKKDNGDLIKKAQSLEEESSRAEIRLKSQGKIIATLREQVSSNRKKPNDALSTENKALVAKIAVMEEELAAYSQSVRDYEASEIALKNKVLESEASLENQQKKFDEAGNPDYDNILKLEEYMKKEIVQLGKSIKESLVKEIKENNKMIEEKLDRKQSSPSGAWHLQRDGDSSENEGIAQTTIQPVAAVDFRTIIQEQQKQQIDEVNDQRSRARNIIIHGVQEVTDAEKTEAKKVDEEFVKNLLSSMAIDDLTFKSVNRIGMKSQEKKRPVLLVMHSEGDKERLLQNLTKLKDQVNYKGISITEDYTVAERKLLTEWRDKAKAKNAEEGESSNYIWRVRGTPKNGLSLKKFMKQKPSAGQSI